MEMFSQTIWIDSYFVRITWLFSRLQVPGELFGAISRNLWINQDIFDILMLKKTVIAQI